MTGKSMCTKYRLTAFKTGFQVPSIKKVGMKYGSKSRAKVGISIMKSRDSRDVLSVIRLIKVIRSKQSFL